MSEYQQALQRERITAAAFAKALQNYRAGCISRERLLVARTEHKEAEDQCNMALLKELNARLDERVSGGAK